MKNKITWFALLGLLVGFIQSANAQAVFDDTYWGGQPTILTAKDVLGSADTFDLTKVETWIDGVDVTINIYGNYFEKILSGDDLFETSMGDLFISTDGLATNDTYADTLDDYFQSPTSYTTWEYAVKLGTYNNDDQGVLDGEKVQDGAIYAVDEDDIVLSTPRSYTHWRKNQEWMLDPTTDSLGRAEWYIGDDNGSNFLSIKIFNFAGIIGDPGSSAIHWTMSCGNDVIETPVVPEPSTIGLLGGLGLIGVIFLRRKIRKA